MRTRKEQEHNIAVIWQLFIAWQTLPANELHNEAFQLLASLGYDGPVTPQLFDLFWKVTRESTDGSGDPDRSALRDRRRCAW